MCTGSESARRVKLPNVIEKIERRAEARLASNALAAVVGYSHPDQGLGRVRELMHGRRVIEREREFRKSVLRTMYQQGWPSLFRHEKGMNELRYLTE